MDLTDLGISRLCARADGKRSLEENEESRKKANTKNASQFVPVRYKRVYLLLSRRAIIGPHDTVARNVRFT